MSSVYQKRRARLKAAVMKDAKRFDMETWFVISDERSVSGIASLSLCEAPTKKEFEQCGTSACLAGTALLEFPKLRAVIKDMGAYGDTSMAVADYLGVDREAFFRNSWPTPLYLEYAKGTAVDKAAAGCVALDHFVLEGKE